MAKHFVNCSTNALEIAYAIAFGIGITANALETLMTFPLVSSKCGIASFVNSTRQKIKNKIGSFNKI